MLDLHVAFASYPSITCCGAFELMGSSHFERTGHGSYFFLLQDYNCWTSLRAYPRTTNVCVTNLKCAILHASGSAEKKIRIDLPPGFKYPKPHFVRKSTYLPPDCVPACRLQEKFAVTSWIFGLLMHRWRLPHLLLSHPSSPTRKLEFEQSTRNAV